ncbi:unnamed protein product [Euphydryas editha]|uniref:Uncharacterized protein n=1 Tax=Euphydryas editha TaxID=104508 RepID=A0AAU9TDH2_EUPED|nr:unnamed protein product [Euphydryas editha]
MSLQRTPPNKFLSDSDLTRSDEQFEHNINTRKRKVPHDDDTSELLGVFEKKFDQQMILWNTNINECISNCVATALILLSLLNYPKYLRYYVISIIT